MWVKIYLVKQAFLAINSNDTFSSVIQLFSIVKNPNQRAIQANTFKNMSFFGIINHSWP